MAKIQCFPKKKKKKKYKQVQCIVYCCALYHSFSTSFQGIAHGIQFDADTGILRQRHPNSSPYYPYLASESDTNQTQLPGWYSQPHRPLSVTFLLRITIPMCHHYPTLSRSEVTPTSFLVQILHPSLSSSPRAAAAASLSDIASDVDADMETGSVQGGDSDGSASGRGDIGDLEQATRGLSLANDNEVPRLPLRGVAYRTWAAEWDPRHRTHSGSSPSCSLAPRKPRQLVGRVTGKKSGNQDGDRKESFLRFSLQMNTSLFYFLGSPI